MDDSRPDFFFGVLLTMVLFAIIVVFLDLRFYQTEYTQCKTRGFIQDKTTRILCSVEEK